MPRRILFIIDSLARTGTARQLLLVSQALARDGWDVHVAALGGRRRRLSDDLQSEFAAGKVPVTYLGRRWAIDPVVEVRHARQVARLRPDIIHTWNVRPSQIISLLLRRDAGPRIVVGQYRVDSNTPSWEWLLLRRAAARIDRFVTNSLTVRDWCVSHKLPADKFTVVLPATSRRLAVESPQPPAPSRSDLLHELHLPPDVKLIGIIGRLVPDKRVKELIWAADLLRVLHDNLRVLVIGDGPQRAQLVRYARMASDLNHIRFLGERSDVDRILPHLDVLWNGSENTGPSIALLEATSAGVPAIASDTPSNRELVVDGETGYLIPLGTRAGRAARARATDRIFTDDALATRLRTNSIERARRVFAHGQFVSAYANLYGRDF